MSFLATGASMVLGFFTKKSALPLIIGGVAAGFAFLWWMRGNEIDRLEADLAQAHSYNTELNETLIRQRIDHAHQLAIISDLEKELRETDNEISEQIGRVRNTPPEDDGPSAPVVNDTLEWLRNQ